MRNYKVRVYRTEERDRVMECAKNHNVNGGSDGVNFDVGIVSFGFVEFKCDKKTWKRIKKELNLEVETVYSKVRVQ